MLNREIAGIRCKNVLDELEAYLSGDLDPAMTGRLEAHLAECDRCAQFGGAYAGVCRDLNQLLGEPEPLDPQVRARLARRLDAELTSASGRNPPDREGP
jgi:anti-sigma factor RsiW